VATSRPPGAARTGLRAAGGALVVMAIVAGLAMVGMAVGAFGSPPQPAATVTALVPTPSPNAGGSTLTPTPIASLEPTAVPSPSATPTVALVPAPLTGLLVSPAAALRHPIAVMVDDHLDARPQAGFNAASIVWQAPAEGGIPRYMLIFQDTVPREVGPVRSSREYFIEWAAEYRAMYVHAGGSPQALTTLRQFGAGQLVWNAEGLRWEGSYLWRVAFRFAPHNLFTDGAHLAALATQLGVPTGPIKPLWAFRAPSTQADRPAAGTISLVYQNYESITYRYDPVTDSYHRFIDGSKSPQIDLADGNVVAPKNVVILRMAFGPLNGVDIHGRLEAADVGSGQAWISTGGVTITGTWRKASVSAPTLLFGPDGRPVVLAPGQTFVQVMKLTDPVRVGTGQAPSPDSALPRTGVAS
jgi:hypothetical protein